MKKMVTSTFAFDASEQHLWSFRKSLFFINKGRYTCVHQTVC